VSRRSGGARSASPPCSCCGGPPGGAAGGPALGGPGAPAPGAASARPTCSVCALVAGLLRRLVCIGGSRRGSGESYYRELANDEGAPVASEAPCAQADTDLDVPVEADADHAPDLALPSSVSTFDTSHFPMAMEYSYQ